MDCRAHHDTLQNTGGITGYACPDFFEIASLLALAHHCRRSSLLARHPGPFQLWQLVTFINRRGQLAAPPPPPRGARGPATTPPPPAGRGGGRAVLPCCGEPTATTM